MVGLGNSVTVSVDPDIVRDGGLDSNKVGDKRSKTGNRGVP